MIYRDLTVGLKEVMNGRTRNNGMTIFRRMKGEIGNGSKGKHLVKETTN